MNGIPCMPIGSQEKNMKKIIYSGLIYCLIFLVSCDQKEQQDSEAAPVALPVVKVPLKDITTYTSYPVSIEGTTTSAVRAKVAGYITAVLVDEGEKVKKGQTLFKLETESLTADAGAAKSNVNAARIEVEKLKPLVEKGIISEVQLKTAEARLAQAEASYKSVSANIDYATIASPINGYVGAIPYRLGALVNPADPTPLTTVAAIDEVYAYFAMNETDYLNFIQTTAGKDLSEKIKNFPPVTLELVNGALYEQKGEITTVTGQINPSTGTVQFRATFPNPNRILASGNSGNIRISKTYENVPVVPAAATFEQQGIVYVYKLRGDTLAVSTSIKITDQVRNLMVVASGLIAGDKIIAQGVGKIRNNSLVKPELVAFDSIANSLDVVFK